jgi:hypothetical protein
MKLNEAVALARSAKTRVHGALTALHRESQKADLYAGLARTYQPVRDDAERFPDESRVVQQNSADVLAEVNRLLLERWNTEANVVAGNNEARADLVLLDGTVLLRDVPATYLLFMEKALEDFYTFTAKLPTLDPAETWTWDANRSVHASKPVETAKEKRVPKPLVLAAATDKHPAQVTTYEDLEVRGYWTTTKLSGALPVEDKRVILLRVVELRDAVKTARERANQLTVTSWQPARTLLNFVLTGNATSAPSAPPA